MATIGPFKSINEPQALRIDNEVMVIVGQNESGKSAVLEALYKSRSVDRQQKFVVMNDYPKKDLARFNRDTPDHSLKAIDLQFRISNEESDAVAKLLRIAVFKPEFLGLSVNYNNSSYVNLSVDEEAVLNEELRQIDLSQPTKQHLSGIKTYSELADALVLLENPTEAEADLQTNVLSRLEALEKAGSGWNLPQREAFVYLNKFVPRFLYFTEYNLLPGCANLADLQLRITEKRLRDSDRAVLSLLRMAGVEVSQLIEASSYEEYISTLQHFSNTVTDRVLNFWKQSTDLQVKFDVREDPKADPPFNNGPNFYTRIHNKVQRVDTSFDSRSRGFIWFFSFIIWFDNARSALEAEVAPILLLDEPGLNLHAAAQENFLNYIDELGKNYQVIYTTHSPFLVRTSEMQRVRVVEDANYSGTTISEDIYSRDARSLLPLQAALGYSLAQNLFIGKKNLLIEGPTDLIYLQAASNALEDLNRTNIDPGITLVPVGGIDKVAAFIALFTGNSLQVVVCTDAAPTESQKIRSMVKERLLKEKNLLDYSMFRKQGSELGKPTDVEDLFTRSHYLDLFNAAYASKLVIKINEADCVDESRIIQGINKWLDANKIMLRGSKGFSHYLVAQRALSSLKFDAIELDAFEELFKKVNSLLGK